MRAKTGVLGWHQLCTKLRPETHSCLCVVPFFSGGPAFPDVKETAYNEDPDGSIWVFV